MTLLVELVAKTPPLSPEKERECFHLPPGFEAQLVAAEPDIQKPMNLAFDAKGRLWVTGSIEYPFPAKGRGRDTGGDERRCSIGCEPSIGCGDGCGGNWSDPDLGACGCARTVTAVVVPSSALSGLPAVWPA